MRRELTTVFAALAALITLAFVIPLAHSAQITAHDRALSAGRTYTASLIPLVGSGSPEELARVIDAMNADDRMRVTVLGPGGPIGAPIGTPARAEAARTSNSSSSGPADGGIELVTAVAGAAGTSVIRVLVPDAELERGVRAAWATLAAVGVVLTLVAVALADRLAQRIVRPARALAEAAHRLGTGQLDVAVEPSGPAELVDTGEAFNTLTDRIQAMLGAEREMVSELTHRLRTPLTRLRIDLDRVADPEVAAELHRSVDALTYEVNDLIDQARRAAHPPAPVEVNAVAAERFEFWSALAAEEDRPCRFLPAGQAALVPVDPEELRAALDVLIENVFAHTDRGAGFQLAVETGPQGARFTVDDTGTGFDPALAQAGVSGGGSTGLGLSIVQRLARTTGGSVEIGRSPLGGARVRFVVGLRAGQPRLMRVPSRNGAADPAA